MFLSASFTFVYQNREKDKVCNTDNLYNHSVKTLLKQNLLTKRNANDESHCLIIPLHYSFLLNDFEDHFAKN